MSLFDIVLIIKYEIPLMNVINEVINLVRPDNINLLPIQACSFSLELQTL